jgi:hypothetical protein
MSELLKLEPEGDTKKPEDEDESRFALRCSSTEALFLTFWPDCSTSQDVRCEIYEIWSSI